MTLRWKHALAAYALLLFLGSAGYALTLIFGDCTGCGPQAILLWPYVLVISIVLSLPGFLLLRFSLKGRETLPTALVAGAALGLVAALCMFAVFSEWPSVMALAGFAAIGAIAGPAQLWLERSLDRRWRQ